MLIWLASYPKSGNTWLRALLTHYVSDGQDTPDLDGLIGTPIASDRDALDEWSGLSSSELTETEVDSLRAAFYRWRGRQGHAEIVCKVHDAWRWTRDGVPLFPPEATKAAVYVVRHPADVAVSYAHHAGVPVSTVIEQLCSSSAMLASMGRRHQRQLPQRLLTWGEHVTSWCDASGMNVVIIRYEDMLSDAVAALTRVVAALGWVVDGARIARAVQACTFDAMQRREQLSGFKERPPSGAAFFRRGVAGDGRTLAPHLWLRLVDVNGTVMRRFGYSTVQADQEDVIRG